MTASNRSRLGIVRGSRSCHLVPEIGSEYDHVRPSLASRLASLSWHASWDLDGGHPGTRRDCQPRRAVDRGLSVQMTDIAAQNGGNVSVSETAILAALGRRSIVLVGMMGVGKSSIGRRLAARLAVPFVDADAEIEKAAGMSISDIFARHGEADFRSGEARVIARLLDGAPQVLATGGGALMNAGTRAAIKDKGVSIWLNAEFDVLMRRINKRKNERPMLQTADPAATLRELLVAREPIYAKADITIQSREAPHEAIVDEIIAALAAFLNVPNMPLNRVGK